MFGARACSREGESMEMQELEIVIDPEGKVSLGVKGVKGSQCTDLTRQLEEALGTIEDRAYTGEYYEQPVMIDTEERFRTGG